MAASGEHGNESSGFLKGWASQSYRVGSSGCVRAGQNMMQNCPRLSCEWYSCHALLLSVRYDDTSHNVSIASSPFSRRAARTRLIYCIRHVLCFIGFRTKLPAILFFLWFLSLRCHPFSFTGKNVFGLYFTKLCSGLVDNSSDSERFPASL
jgi:hypothetical protein